MDATIFTENSSLALYAAYAAFGMVVFIMAFFGVLPKFTLRRSLIGLSFIVALVMGYGALGELLSRPKPVPLMTWDAPNVEEAKVVGFYLIEDQAIFLLLHYDGIKVPRYYEYPWNQNLAEDLQRADRAKRMGDIKGFKLLRPFQKSWEDRRIPEVYELPWPAPEIKDDPGHEIIDLDKQMV